MWSDVERAGGVCLEVGSVLQTSEHPANLFKEKYTYTANYFLRPSFPIGKF